MRIGRGNRSNRRKLAPHNLTWTGTRAAAVDSRRLTASSMLRPKHELTEKICNYNEPLCAATPHWVIDVGVERLTAAQEERRRE
jgi:hypothetical protein